MLKTRKERLLTAAIALAVLVAGTAAAGGGSQSKGGASSYKVGLLMSGPMNDGGWNASAYEGLTEIKNKYPDVQISYQEGIPASDYEEIFRTYASQGYNLVFGHGYEFGDAALKVAKDFPNVKFCVTSTDVSAAPNVSSMLNNYHEMGYLLGVIAATMTKTNVVGAIGGMEIPSITEALIAYEVAVKSENPQIKVMSVLTGTFEDVAKAKETALTMIEQGADIIFHDADQSGFGVFEACKEKGVMALGSIADQASIEPNTILTSGICSVGKGMLGIFELVLQGKLEPKNYAMGAAQGAVYVAPFRNFDSQVPQALKDRIAKIEADMKSGAFDAVAFTEKGRASR
ncbi:MAG: BMP family protein [Treponema sp.]|jgi:basic membrane protein A|nr:BMP family protein [Treponema sp.]